MKTVPVVTHKSFSEYCARKRAEFGSTFDASCLAPAFIPYYENGARVEIRSAGGTLYRGRVGVTTGWKPAFLLLFTRRSMGSWYTLSSADTVVRIIAQ